MPGGWCEYNLSPAENTIKECKEEAGLDIIVKSVIAIQDRDRHNLPPYAYGVVKVFYECEAIGGTLTQNSETSESAFFSLGELPPLAEEKCIREQIEMCFRAHGDDHWKTQFD